ncbi:MAG TPA: hypothetical protein VNL98_05795, partial [Gemmatimonadales bacterium]|nr:hypothetical protein [Gemmatimonadales bacterium]
MLIREERGKSRVAACCAIASRRGIRVGMALAEARALTADLEALPWDEEAIARAALEVTSALLSASPRVSWHRSAGAPGHQDGIWWVDAAGLGDER